MLCFSATSALPLASTLSIFWSLDIKKTHSQIELEGKVITYVPFHQFVLPKSMECLSELLQKNEREFYGILDHYKEEGGGGGERDEYWKKNNT